MAYNVQPKKNIKNLKPYEPGKPIEELGREIHMPVDSIIKLASNENPLGPSPKAIAAIKSASRSVNRYPDGACFYLKEKISQRLGIRSCDIIIGNGSDELLDIVIKAFADKNDEVIISEPAFLEYDIISKSYGLKIKAIPMIRDYKDNILSGFRYDIEKMLQAISKKTKVIFLGNPDNPTGAYLGRKPLKEFINNCPKNVIILIDEAYRELVNAEDYSETINYIKRKNVILLRTFSKAYGLAGLRIGYGIADRFLTQWMERSRQPFNVNMIAQKAAQAAFDDTEFVDKVKRLVECGMSFISSGLKRMGFNVIESPANFILFSYKGVKGTDLFLSLLPKGIIVRDMKPYGLNEWARVSAGTMIQNRKFIQAVKSLRLGN
jgi:histidinol-phosphate aminotransferase